jgi:hypothetical protein
VQKEEESHEIKALQVLKEANVGDALKKKRKRPRGPNPLSCKKKKLNKGAVQKTQDPQKKKPARRRKKKTIAETSN